jgi:hypothetical protein
VHVKNTDGIEVFKRNTKFAAVWHACKKIDARCNDIAVDASAARVLQRCKKFFPQSAFWRRRAGTDSIKTSESEAEVIRFFAARDTSRLSPRDCFERRRRS